MPTESPNLSMNSGDQAVGSGSRGRRNVLFAVLAGLGLVLILVIPTILPLGKGFFFHDTCEKGSPISSATIWTPLLVVNAPQFGTAYGRSNGTLYPWSSSQPLELNLSDGAVGILMANVNWTLVHVHVARVSGAGDSTGCAMPFEAIPQSGGPPVTCYLQGATNLSDANVSTSTPVAGCPFLGTNMSAQFPDAYNQTVCTYAERAAWSCEVYGVSEPAGWGIGPWLDSISVALPMLVGGKLAWIPASMPQTVSLVYSSENSGCWRTQYIDSGPRSNGWIAWGPYSADLNESECYTLP